MRDARILSLRDALAVGLERNLDVQIEELAIPASREGVEIERADFDPALEATLFSEERKTPSSSSLTSGGFNINRETGGDVALRKKSVTGLDSRLSLAASKTANNSRVDGLRPQYPSQLLLNLTQPLLRDFGAANTAAVRIAENAVEQSFYTYVDQAQRTAEEIELSYFQLAEAVSTYQYRIESKNLGLKLLEGNQAKFAAGLAPISEVQETQTALAERDLALIAAQQVVELAENRLKDLLEIREGDPLYREPLMPEAVPELEPHIPSLEEALAVALQNRPDLKTQRLVIENWALRLEYEKNQTLPRLDLLATLGLNGLSGTSRSSVNVGGTVTPPNPHTGDFPDTFGHLVEGDGLEWYVGLRVTYPLGNRAAEARFRRSNLQKTQAIYALKNLEGRIETEVKNALVNVRRSMERVRVAQEYERLAEISLEQEMQRFTEGTSDTFRILDFQDDVIEARIRKIIAMVDFHRGLANLYRANGMNLSRYGIEVGVDEEFLAIEGDN
ncbi:MAG TPA: TolC family protein [bacterium]|nr:TolC family protein [bacterium]HOL96439.1 TolC family protein [bacterium]